MADELEAEISALLVLVVTIAGGALSFFILALSAGGVESLMVEFDLLSDNQRTLAVVSVFPYLTAIAGTVRLLLEPDEWQVSEVLWAAVSTYLLQVVGFLYVVLVGPGR